MNEIANRIKGGLIVSCQALKDEPLHGSDTMAKMALSVMHGGACGIRANTYEDIKAIKAEVDLPVIGIVKRIYDDSDVYITPTIKEVAEVIEAGAEIVALDCTNRTRPHNESLERLIENIRKQFPKMLIMADVSDYKEGIKAESLGVDFISTTLAGYTEYTANLVNMNMPDFNLIKELVNKVRIPIIAEGRINTPEQARMCLEYGAHAIVVGGAITRPRNITENFICEIEQKKTDVNK